MNRPRLSGILEEIALAMEAGKERSPEAVVGVVVDEQTDVFLGEAAAAAAVGVATRRPGPDLVVADARAPLDVAVVGSATSGSG